MGQKGHVTWQKMKALLKPLPATRREQRPAYEAESPHLLPLSSPVKRAKTDELAMTQAHYLAEMFIKNRLQGPLKQIIGTNHDRKRPLILTNDTGGAASQEWVE